MKVLTATIKRKLLAIEVHGVEWQRATAKPKEAKRPLPSPANLKKSPRAHK